MSLTLVMVTILSIFLVPSILGQIIFVHTIESHGTVKVFGLGVYWDIAKTAEVKSIDWGLIEPGLPSSVSVYITNEGDYPTTFSLTAGNWHPTDASNYFSLSWDYGNQLVEPGETVLVTLTLLPSANIQDVKDFGVGVVIAGSG